MLVPDSRPHRATHADAGTWRGRQVARLPWTALAARCRLPPGMPQPPQVLSSQSRPRRAARPSVMQEPAARGRMALTRSGGALDPDPRMLLVNEILVLRVM